MSGYNIAISGLNVAQRALELIGTNIANAGTAGYHRQSLKIIPRQYGGSSSLTIGGAEIDSIRRALDDLLERELLSQHPQLAQVAEELLALQSIESALGNLDSQGLSIAIDNFFGALSELSTQPNNLSLQEQVIWAADEMSAQFRHIGQFLSDLNQHVIETAAQQMELANGLLEQIAQLNDQIESIRGMNGNINLLCDQRDQAITELSEFINVQARPAPNREGVVNVTAWGIPLVTSNTYLTLQTGLTDGGQLGVSISGDGYYRTELSGGKIAGLIALHNTLITDVQDDMDLMAGQIMTQINKLHVQGIGAAGSFTQMMGIQAGQGSSTLEELDLGISNGSLFVRVTDLDTDEVTITEIVINDISTMTLDDLAAEFDALTGLNASIADRRLNIQASDETRYRFDFLPVHNISVPLPGGSAEPTLSGTYTGEANDVLTFTIVGTGQVGIDEISINVTNGQGELLETLNVGAGYAEGDVIQMANGVNLAFGYGQLNDGDSFDVNVLADSDTTSALAGLGINTFFEGNSALNISVRDEFLTSPDRFAVSLSPGIMDNTNARRMTQIGEDNLSALNNTTISNYFRTTATGVGQKIATRQARQDALETLSVQLVNQQQEISGVDINEEAAKMMVFERMFQAVAKFMSVQQQTMDQLMELL